MKNPLMPAKPKQFRMENPPNQSKGILDDFAVRKSVQTKEHECLSFKMPTGAGATKVLTSDASGNGTWQASSGGGGGFSYPIALTNVKAINAYVGNLGALADIDVYTVPAGKKALVLSLMGYQNSGAPIVTTPRFSQDGATYYNIAAGTSCATDNVVYFSSLQFLLHAGERLAAYATAAGMNIWYRVLEFEDTVKITRGLLITPAAGNNTLYTCPVDTTAAILDYSCDINNAVTTAVPTVATYNARGGNTTIYLNVVPSGDAVGATNKIIKAIAISNGSRGMHVANAYLEAGDFININVDIQAVAPAYFLAWCLMVENAV